MKICYLYLHRFAGRGSGRYMQSLIEYLKKGKHELFLVEGLRSKHSALRGVKDKYVHFPFQVPVYKGRQDVRENVKISGVPDSQIHNIVSRFSEWVIRIHEKNGLDVVHASHASVLPFSACIAKKITGLPYTVTVHGTGMQSSLESGRNFSIAKEGLVQSSAVIANSEFLKRDVVKNFGIKSSMVKVLYPGVDTSVLKPVSKRIRSAVKRRYGCEDKRVVLSTGYFTEDMGFQHLLESASLYEKENPDIVTIISGQGPYQKEMERIIKEKGLKNTKIVGWLLRKDLVKLYGAADLFVKPAVSEEPFGLVSVEALAAGTPVIATRIGGLPEIVTKDVGELVEPHSPQALADAVLNRIGDDSWLSAKGKNARKRVLGKFSSEVRGKGMEKVYAQAVSRG